MRIIDIIRSPWAIMPGALSEIVGIYETHLRGDKIDIAGIEARIGKPLGKTEQGYSLDQGVATIPILGTIAKRMNLFSNISDGVSTELIKRDFLAALGDPSVNAIILNIDSPGGTVDGTLDLAKTIYESRGTKPIVAYTSGTMASAAYWIGSAADKVFIIDETTQVGSIGVVAAHRDVSKMQEKTGVTTTEITAGKYKRIASQYAPLTDEGRASIQDTVDHIYSLFVGSIAVNRGVSPDTVLARMADGRVFNGTKAIEAGLVDGVSTLEGLIASLSKADGVSALFPTLSTSSASSTASGPFGSAQGPDKTSPDSKSTQEESTTMDIETLKKDHASLYEAVFAAGRVEGMTAGATAELDRIKGVLALGSAGNKELVEAMAYDGKSVADAAIAIVTADKAKLEGKFKALETESVTPVPVDHSNDGSSTPPAASAAAVSAAERINKIKGRA